MKKIATSPSLCWLALWRGKPSLISPVWRLNVFWLFLHMCLPQACSCHFVLPIPSSVYVSAFKYPNFPEFHLRFLDFYGFVISHSEISIPMCLFFFGLIILMNYISCFSTFCSPLSLRYDLFFIFELWGRLHTGGFFR